MVLPPCSKNSVLLEDISDAGPLDQNLAHLVLPGHFLERAGDDIFLYGCRHDHAAVVVCEHQVAVRHGDAGDGNRAANGDDLEAAFGVGGREPGRKHRKLHVDDPPAVSAQSIEHDAPAAPGSGVRAEQLAPERAARLTLNGADDHLTWLETVQ